MLVNFAYLWLANTLADTRSIGKCTSYNLLANGNLSVEWVDIVRTFPHKAVNRITSEVLTGGSVTHGGHAQISGSLWRLGGEALRRNQCSKRSHQSFLVIILGNF